MANTTIAISDGQGQAAHGLPTGTDRQCESATRLRAQQSMEGEWLKNEPLQYVQADIVQVEPTFT